MGRAVGIEDAGAEVRHWLRNGSEVPPKAVLWPCAGRAAPPLGLLANKPIGALALQGGMQDDRLTGIQKPMNRPGVLRFHLGLQRQGV